MDSDAFFDTLSDFSSVLAVKLYRLQPSAIPRIPTLPCLDHEAMLHEGIASHAAAYVRDRFDSLHEIVFFPSERRLDVDVLSTMGEYTPESHEELLTVLRTRFPGCRVDVNRPSWLRGDLRVAKACRAQVTLREVLTGDNLDRTKVAIDRLQTISTLMEKESRVASWGARTVMTPILAVVGFLTYQLVGTALPSDSVSVIRTAIVGIIGGLFLYYGVKAVQLTHMANRVWKRATEYGLILNERRRFMQWEERHHAGIHQQDRPN
jgi:hypothetical protein